MRLNRVNQQTTKFETEKSETFFLHNMRTGKFYEATVILQNVAGFEFSARRTAEASQSGETYIQTTM